MRVFGMIMILLGTMFAGILLIYLLSSSMLDGGLAAISNTDIALAAILLGIPSLLLFKYGFKLWRRKATQIPEAADDHSVIHAQPLQVSQPMARTLKPTLPVTPKPRPTVCKNCGASGRVIPGQETACEYCGTIL